VFPRPVGSDDPSTARHDLYRWLRRSGRLDLVAKNAGPWCLPSPSGRKLLVETFADKHLALAVVDSDGRWRWDLRFEGRPADGRYFSFTALEPAWMGDEHIVLAGPVANGRAGGADDRGRTRYELALYRLGTRGRLERVRVISRDWEQSLKPYTALWPASQPAP
jgi:hypothetical protein